MKKMIAATSAAMLMAGCASMDDDGMAAADNRAPMTATAQAARELSPMSRQFGMMSASGNMFEIESSRLAMQRSQNPMVQQFAQMMINDHSQMMSQMAALAAPMGIDVNAIPMAPHHRQMLDRLSAAGSGPSFDMAYHQAQLAAHQESLQLHQNYASNGDHPELRALAAQAVPVIQQHLGHLQSHGQHMQHMQQPAPSGRRAGERG
jgi:putative membrane protein